MDLRHETISFISDYGLDDEFVGVCKSVIRSLAPGVTVIDITHGVPPHDVRAGALTLARSVQYLSPGVVLAVVDPGVGTERRPVAVEVGGGQSVLVGPDNGLLAPAVAMCEGATRAVELTNPDYQLPAPGATFDGRDVFAPAAAHLCAGAELSELGDEVDPATLRPGIMPVPRVEDGALVAESLWVDRFGNIQLNVDPDEIAEWGDRIRIRFGGRSRTALRVGSYAEILQGQVGLVVDSHGLISIAVDRMSASELLDLGPSEEVVLEPLPEENRDRTPTDEAGGDVTVPVEVRPPES